MAVLRKTPKMVSIPNSFCPGCGHGILNRLIAEVIEENGYEDKTILTLGVGCSCNMNMSWNGDKIQTAHGRGAATAMGIKVARPDLLSIAYQGDGDAYVIGLAETMNAAYRNENITVFVVNNNNFGMTGGQMSWTTMEGQKTTTSQHGRDCSITGAPIRFPEMVAREFDIAYAARGSVSSPANIRKTKKFITEALKAQMNKEGYSIVEVLSPCPVNWGMTPIQAMERLDKEVEPYYPVGVIKARKEAK